MKISLYSRCVEVLFSKKELRLKTLFLSRFVLLFIVLQAPLMVVSQQQNQQQGATISGKITDERGEGLPGVTIVVVGTIQGTTTDIDGNFNLNVSEFNQSEIMIAISYVGYTTIKKSVNVSKDKILLNVSLEPDLLSLQEVVITGTTNPKTKLESSVAISSIKAKEIELRVPRSNSDLLKAVPGLWVESTGGEGPANVWVRGFPQAGGYGFVGIMEDGLPVFQGGYSGIPSPDLFYKTDLNIKTVEAIRGGTAPIIAQGASGAVINHISKTGSSEFGGAAKLTYSPTQNLYRTDFNIGGPLSDDLFYNFGGFYRTDQGVYDFGYQGNKGGQFKGNIKKWFDKGFIKVHGKYINDRVNYNLPIAYQYNKNGDVEGLPGFDIASDGSTLREEETKYSFNQPDGTTVNRNIQDGLHTTLASAGFEVEFDLGNNWKLNNKFRYDDISLSNDIEVVVGVDSLNLSPLYYFSDGTPVMNPTDPNNLLNGNGLGLQSILAGGENEYQNLINRLELTNSRNRNAITIGIEYFNFQMEQDASQSLFTKEVRHNPRSLTLPDATGQPGSTFLSLAFLDPQGIHRADGLENTYSLYITDEYELTSKLRLDAAFRIDHKSIEGKTALKEGSSLFEGGSGFTYNGEYEDVNDEATNWVATLGLNYKLNEKTALFARGSRSYNGIKLGDYIGVGADVDALKALEDREIIQVETGLKIGTSRFALFSSILYANVNNVVSDVSIPSADGSALISQQAIVSTRTFSAEIEAQYKLTDELLLKLVTTLQDPEYTDYTIVGAPGTLIEGEILSFKGNTAERVPQLTNDFTVSYAKGKFNGFINWRIYSDRWSTPANNVKLKGFSEVYAGLGYDILKNLKFKVNAANLFNTVALTEGNTRGDQFVNVDALDGNPAIGRRVMPFTLFTNLIFEF